MLAKWSQAVRVNAAARRRGDDHRFIAGAVGLWPASTVARLEDDKVSGDDYPFFRVLWKRSLAAKDVGTIRMLSHSSISFFAFRVARRRIVIATGYRDTT